MTKSEYHELRFNFLQYACKHGLSAGSDEFGYHDDDMEAAKEWKRWFHKAKENESNGLPLMHQLDEK